MVPSGINESKKNKHVPIKRFPMMFVEKLFAIKLVKDIPFLFDIKKGFEKSIHPLKWNDLNNVVPFQGVFIWIPTCITCFIKSIFR